MPDPLEITYAVKDFFFDRAAVMEKVGAKRNKALLTAGAYIRRKARDLLRRGKKPAKPGSPPKIHSDNEPGLKTILFALDPATDSMVVGPIKFNSRGLRKSNRETIPEIQEFGGTAEVIEYTPDEGETWLTLDELRANKYSRSKVRSRTRQATYAAHPFMSVALERALPKIPEQFRDLI